MYAINAVVAMTAALEPQITGKRFTNYSKSSSLSLKRTCGMDFMVNHFYFIEYVSAPCLWVSIGSCYSCSGCRNISDQPRNLPRVDGMPAVLKPHFMDENCQLLFPFSIYGGKTIYPPECLCFLFFVDKCEHSDLHLVL